MPKSVRTLSVEIEGITTYEIPWHKGGKQPAIGTNTIDVLLPVAEPLTLRLPGKFGQRDLTKYRSSGK